MTLLQDIQTALWHMPGSSQVDELLRRVGVAMEEESQWHSHEVLAYVSVYDGGSDYHTHSPEGGELTRAIGSSVSSGQSELPKQGDS